METSIPSVYQEEVESRGGWINKSYERSSFAMTSPTSWTQERCPVFEFVISSIVIGSISIVGLILNTLSYAVLTRDKNNEVATFLLKSLSLADNSVLLVSLIILSFFFGPYQIPAAHKVLSSAMPFMRIIVHPLGYIAQSCSIWMTVLLAINRFVAVCYPFHSERYLTLRLAKIQVAVVVFFSILVNFPRFFMYVLINDHNSTNGTDTPRIYYKPSSLLENASFNLYYMNVFYSSIVLILPLLILVVFNFAIIHAIRKSANSMRRNSMNMKGGKQEKNLTVVMIVIIVELLLCHSLDRVLLVLKHVMPPSASKCPNSLNYASHASNLLIIINSATDFFIYVIFKKRFRKLLRNMCSCLACCREKRKVSTSQRPSSCSQLSNDINKIDILKQMELKSGQYKQLTSSNSFRNERSPSDSVFLPAGGTPLLSRIKSKTLRG